MSDPSKQVIDFTNKVYDDIDNTHPIKIYFKNFPFGFIIAVSQLRLLGVPAVINFKSLSILLSQ